MHYTYVLLSNDQGRFYTGYTGDLRKRLREHHRGQVRWTASRQPVQLVYYEACLSPDDAPPPGALAAARAGRASPTCGTGWRPTTALLAAISWNGTSYGRERQLVRAVSIS